MVLSRSSDAAALGRPAAVVGDGGDVANQGDLEARALQSAERALASGAGAFHEYGDRAHAVLHCASRGLFGGELRGERRALARPLEAARAGRRPSDGGAVDVGDGDDGVVEGRLDVRNARRNVLADLLLLFGAFAGRRRAGR